MGAGKTLLVAIFPTKKDPKAEVISVQVQKYEDEKWENFGKIAVHMSPEENYSRLPDRDKPSEIKIFEWTGNQNTKITEPNHIQRLPNIIKFNQPIIGHVNKVQY